MMMNRSYESIQQELIRSAVTDIDVEQWNNLTSELRGSLLVWGQVAAIVNSELPKSFEELFGTNAWATGLMHNHADRHAKLLRLLGISNLVFDDWISILPLLAFSLEWAQFEDDMDELILTFGEFFRLEQGGVVSEPRVVVYRQGFTDREFPLVLTDGSADDERSLYEYCGPDEAYLELKVGSLASEIKWWNYWEKAFHDVEKCRETIGRSDLSKETFAIAVQALQPIFSAVNRERRIALRVTVSLIVDFLKFRGLPDVGRKHLNEALVRTI
jgi:hypothetical protein